MPSSWSRLLNRELKSLVKSNDSANGLPRIAFVGVGNELKADDIAGLVVVRQLAQSLGTRSSLLFLDAGTALENVSGMLRRFQPDIVVLIDAVDMQEAAGKAAWLDFDALDSSNAFTHAPLPAMLGKFLRNELHCQIALIGIQPGSLEFDQPASAIVIAAAHAAASEIRQTLIELEY